MILDKENLVSDGQDVYVTGFVWSDDYIDMGADSAKIQQFVERAGKLFCQIDTEMDSAGGGAALRVEVFVSDDPAFAIAPTKIAGFADPVVEVLLVAGFRFTLPEIPAHISKRYLRFRYKVITEDFTSGAVSAGIILDEQTSGVMAL